MKPTWRMITAAETQRDQDARRRSMRRIERLVAAPAHRFDQLAGIERRQHVEQRSRSMKSAEHRRDAARVGASSWRKVKPSTLR